MRSMCCAFGRISAAGACFFVFIRIKPEKRVRRGKSCVYLRCKDSFGVLQTSRVCDKINKSCPAPVTRIFRDTPHRSINHKRSMYFENAERTDKKYNNHNCHSRSAALRYIACRFAHGAPCARVISAYGVFHGDLHGQVDNLPYYYTIIQQARHNGENVLLLDCGDLSYGGPRQERAACRRRGCWQV